MFDRIKNTWRDDERVLYVKKLLEDYGLKEFMNHYPTSLSGGMRQRVALIRTLAMKPDILLLDEPFSALDYQTRLAVSDDVYKIIRDTGKTVIMITHDIAEAISMASRVVVLTERPSRVKKIYNIEMKDKSTPINNRKCPEFSKYYDMIWKEIDYNEYKRYLRRLKIEKILVYSVQLLIIIGFNILWEYTANRGIINTFIYSSPSRIFITISGLYQQHNLFNHIWVTVYETVISFSLATILGTFIAIILWYSKFLYKVFDPYLTVLNSLPKVALGPIIIIVCGANIKSIIIMALLISIVITISNVYSGFVNTDKNKIKLLKSFGASKWQMLRYLIIPGNYHVIINSLKINVGMSMVGGIMGEFLVSKEGIGYLINYGSEVFNLNLVFAGIVILLLVSYLMYLIVLYIEKALIRNN